MPERGDERIGSNYGDIFIEHLLDRLLTNIVFHSDDILRDSLNVCAHIGAGGGWVA